MQTYASCYKKSIAAVNFIVPGYIKTVLPAMDWATIGDKIRMLREAKGLKQSKFSLLVGVRQPNLSRYENNKVVPEDRTLKDILTIAGANMDWWETGEGEAARPHSGLLKKPIPYVNGDDQEARSLSIVGEDVQKTWSGSEFRELSDDRLLMTIPLVDEFAYAGYLSGWKDPEFIEDLPRHSIVVPKRHTGCYRAFAVKGDSMDNDRRDAICAEDVVVGRSIDKHFWNAKFHLNKFRDYVVVHQDGILIKRIVSHDVEEGIISCSSINPDKTAYPDFDVKLADVYEIYNIVSVERKRKI